MEVLESAMYPVIGYGRQGSETTCRRSDRDGSFPPQSPGAKLQFGQHWTNTSTTRSHSLEGQKYGSIGINKVRFYEVYQQASKPHVGSTKTVPVNSPTLNQQNHRCIMKSYRQQEDRRIPAHRRRLRMDQST